MSFAIGRFSMFPFGDLSGGNSEEFCELYLREFHFFTQVGDVFGSNELSRLADGLCWQFRESIPRSGFRPWRAVYKRCGNITDRSHLPGIEFYFSLNKSGNFLLNHFLLFLINTAGSFDYSGRGTVSWIGSQLLSCSIAVGVYEAVSYAVLRVWRSILPVNWLFLGVAGLLLIPCLLLLLMTLFFILFRKGGNAFYSDVMQFLTSQKFGSLFSVSLFSMLAVLIFLVVVNSFGISRMAVADFRRPAYLIIMLMCAATLLVFSLFYTERKP